MAPPDESELSEESVEQLEPPPDGDEKPSDEKPKPETKAERKAREKAERDAARAAKEQSEPPPDGDEKPKPRGHRVWPHGELVAGGRTFKPNAVLNLDLGEEETAKLVALGALIVEE